MSEEGLAERLGISREEASELFARYHAAYPQIRKWMERTIRLSHEQGYVTTRFGRKVRIWEYEDADNLDSAWAARARRRAGERTAGNAPIQGAATGDYKKACMVHAQRALKAAGLDDRVLLVMDIHDALEWYVREDVAPETVIRLLNPEVTRPVSGWPPMVAEWHVGERWGSLIELELLPDSSVRAKRKADVPEALPGEEPGEEDQEEYLPPVKGTVALGTAAVPKKARVPSSTSEPEPPGVPGHVSAPEDQIVPREKSEPPLTRVPSDASGPSPSGVPSAKSEPPAPSVPSVKRGSARTVYVELSGVPHQEQAARFMELLGSLPGSDSVILRIEGLPDITVPGTFSLGPHHGPQVSVIFGGALVYYDLDSVDMAALAEGLNL